MITLAINAFLGLVALFVLWRSIRRAGLRVWVHVYAFGVVLWGVIAFCGVLFGLLSIDSLPALMRPAWSLMYIYLIVDYLTERRA